MTSPWRKLPDGFNRCSPVGFVTMGAFIPRYFGARYARWMIFSCVGQNANTNDSGTTLREPGVGCTACKLGSRTFSRIGLWYQRLDDRSRMNREVHVRFWEGLAVRFHWATQLSQCRDKASLDIFWLRDESLKEFGQSLRSGRSRPGSRRRSRSRS